MPSVDPHPQIGSRARSTSSNDRHAVEQVGVAGEVDTLAVVFARPIAVDDEPERRRGELGVRPASGLVLGVNDLDAQRSDLEKVALDDLGDVVEPGLAQQRPGVARHDEGGRSAAVADRREVDVVEVDVREQRDVDVGVCRPTGVAVGDGDGRPAW